MTSAETVTPILDCYFPPNGPCGFCGDELIGARHRMIDSLAEQVHVGENIDVLAQEMNVSATAVIVAAAFDEGWKAGRKRPRRNKEQT